MVTLDTLLIVSSISFAGGVLITLLFGLLIAILRNSQDNDDEEVPYAIPLSALMGGGGGGVPNAELANMYRAAQAAHAAGAGAGAPPKKEEKKEEIGGQYI